MSYQVFTRRWWKLNPSWPDGREPDATDRKRNLCVVDTEEEAREACREWQATAQISKLDRKLSLKAEYESI